MLNFVTNADEEFKRLSEAKKRSPINDYLSFVSLSRGEAKVIP
jgi:hypothetical protein